MVALQIQLYSSQLLFGLEPVLLGTVQCLFKASLLLLHHGLRFLEALDLELESVNLLGASLVVVSDTERLPLQIIVLVVKALLLRLDLLSLVSDLVSFADGLRKAVLKALDSLSKGALATLTLTLLLVESFDHLLVGIIVSLKGLQALLVELDIVLKDSLLLLNKVKSHLELLVLFLQCVICLL